MTSTINKATISNGVILSNVLEVAARSLKKVAAGDDGIASGFDMENDMQVKQIAGLLMSRVTAKMNKENNNVK